MEFPNFSHKKVIDCHKKVMISHAKVIDCHAKVMDSHKKVIVKCVTNWYWRSYEGLKD